MSTRLNPGCSTSLNGFWCVLVSTPYSGLGQRDEGVEMRHGPCHSTRVSNSVNRSQRPYYLTFLLTSVQTLRDL